MRWFVWIPILLIFLCPASRAATVIFADNLEFMTRFYAVDLGLRVARADANTGEVAFSIPGDTLYITARPRTGGGEALPAQVRVQVKSLSATQGALKAANVAYWAGVSSRGKVDGLFCRDPEGNTLWFVQGSSAAVPESVGRFALLDTDGAAQEISHTGMIIYGSLYGAFVGAATTIGLGSTNSDQTAITGVLGTALGALSANNYARTAKLDLGRFEMLVLAGNFGILQGLGWSRASSATAQTTAITGSASGVATLYLANEVLKRVVVSPEQAALLHSATYWGAWYGFLGAKLAGKDFEANNDRVLGAMLWGSSGGLAAGVVLSLNGKASAKRVNLVNASGVIGTALGYGLAESLKVRDVRTYYVYPAAGGLLGLGGGMLWHVGAPQGAADANNATLGGPMFAFTPGGLDLRLFQLRF